MLEPLTVWLPHRAWLGWDGYFVELIYVAFLILVCLFCLFAGALTIAPEIEKQTWESLYLAPIGVASVVRAKLICRLARCGAALALTLPFWLAWAYEAFTVNGVGPAKENNAQSGMRMGIYLSWTGLRLAAHAIPCVAIGGFFSAIAKRGRAAMGMCGALVVGYGSALWTLSGLFTYDLGGRLTDYLTTAIYWPILPIEWNRYESIGLWPPNYGPEIAADCLWLLAIPAGFAMLTIARCRRLRS